MEIDIQSPQPYSRTIVIRVPPEEVDERYARMLAEVAKDVSWPGFRKGKVPKEIVRQRYGEAAASELAEQFVKEGYAKAIEQGSFRPMMRPRAEKEPTLVPGQEFVVEVKVEIEPPIELHEYKGLSLNRKREPVTDREIDGVVEELRRRAGNLEPIVDRAAQVGDFVLVDFLPKDDKKTTKRFFQLDESATITILGHNPGDKFDGHFEFPNDWPDEDLAGTILDAAITLLELKKMVYPELDGNFFSQFGNDIKELEDLRRNIRKDLEENHTRTADRNLHSSAKDELIKKNPIEISPLVIDVAVENMLHSYWDTEKLTEDQLKEIRTNIRPGVIRDITTDLLLYRIAESENITIGDDAVKKHVIEVAAYNKVDPDALYRYWKKEDRLDSIRANLRCEKVLDWVIENANITEG